VTVTLNNSTVTGNTAAIGVGVDTEDAILALVDSAVTGNTAGSRLD
jgi:hypothetical protein